MLCRAPSLQTVQRVGWDAVIKDGRSRFKPAEVPPRRKERRGRVRRDGGLAPALIPQSIIKTLNIASQHIFEFKELQSLVRPVHLCVRAKSLKNERVKTLIETIADAVPRAVVLKIVGNNS